MLLEKIKFTTDFLLEKTNGYRPEVGIILGTGLGGLVKEIESAFEIPYEEIPNFPVSTVQGHSGRLIFGELGGKKVMAMKGRFHFYEGYDMQQITFPVRVMKAIGIHTLCVSNASGGVNPSFEIGEIMIINDQINLFPTNPLIGHNYPELGPRFLDMSEAYDKKLVLKAQEIAKSNGIKVSTGCYAALTGPCFETPGEYLYIKNVGADTVGMSTVPEVIVARHGGMRVFGMSIITDLGVQGKIVEVSHEEVQVIAAAQEPKLSLIVKEVVRSL
jgi:purine-nucleoside phosphorylase